MSEVATYWNERALSGVDVADTGGTAQFLRYAAFTQFHDLAGKKIFDIGCGAGDFLQYLKDRETPCEYSGIDISEEMVRLCEARFPGSPFACIDIMRAKFASLADYTVAFGIHNNVRISMAALRAFTARQFELSRIGAHISLLNDRYKGFASDRIAWSVEHILSMALSITPYVTLRTDYLPHDFSVTLYRGETAR